LKNSAPKKDVPIVLAPKKVNVKIKDHSWTDLSTAVLQKLEELNEGSHVVSFKVTT